MRREPQVAFTDITGLKFEPMPQREAADPVEQRVEPVSPRALTIAKAKKGLALTFGVKPEAVEITIRG